MARYAAPEVVAEIYPETLAKRILPANFNQEHLSLFDLDLEREIPQSQLIRLQNIRISPEGLLFAGTRLLPESFAFPWHVDDWTRRRRWKFFATNYLFRQRRRLDPEVLWITDYWSTSYFHWLTDALTRLFVVRDRLADLALMLPAGYETREVVRSSLKAFGAKAVDFVGPNEVLECRSVLMPTHTAYPGHFRLEAIRGVRNVLLSAFGDSHYQGAGERLYISRKQANKRRIVNEDDLSALLSKFGFQTIYAEELAFAEQVRTCSQARFIVSNHGAGLTNVLFMKEGGSLLELRHQTDRIQNCYFILSTPLNLNYFYQTCAPRDPAEDPHSADLFVDPEELERNLQLLLR